MDMSAWQSRLPGSTTNASYHEMTDFGKQYINQLWELSKAVGQASRLLGKPAPVWRHCFDKVRELMPVARVRFMALNDEEKRSMTKFEDVFGRGCLKKCLKRTLPPGANETNLKRCYL